MNNFENFDDVVEILNNPLLERQIPKIVSPQNEVNLIGSIDITLANTIVLSEAEATLESFLVLAHNHHRT